MPVAAVIALAVEIQAIPGVPLLEAIIVGEIVKPFLADFTKGVALTNELTPRIAERLYVSGIITQAQFAERLRLANLKPEDQQAYLDDAEVKIRDLAELVKARLVREYATQLKGEYKAYDNLFISTVAKPLDELDDATTDLITELNKIEASEVGDGLDADISFRQKVLNDIELKLKVAAV